MCNQLTQPRVKRFVALAIVLTLAGGFTASLAFARLVRNTIDPIAVVADNGRHIVVTGPIAYSDEIGTDCEAKWHLIRRKTAVREVGAKRRWGFVHSLRVVLLASAVIISWFF